MTPTPTGGSDTNAQRRDGETAWRTALRGIVAATPLWLDRGPAARGTPHSSDSCERVLPADLVEGVRGTASAIGVSAHAAIAAAWALVLTRQSGEEDVLFGVADAALGPRPIRAFVNHAASFATLARAIAEADGALAVSRVPLDRVRATSEIPEGDSFFHTMVVEAGTPAVDVPVALVLQISADGERLKATFDGNRMDRWAAEQSMEHFEVALRAFADSPDQPTANVSLLSPARQATVVREWASPLPGFRSGDLVHARFEQQAARTPDAIALLFDELSLTYRELDRRANRVAHALVRAGVTPGQCVGICLERTPNLMVAVLGILKAGAAYVPLDPKYPADRLAFSLADTGAPVVIAQRETASALGSGSYRVIELNDGDAYWATLPDHSPNIAIDDDAIAYVIYTSGSTGTPKGVLVTHANVVRLFDATRQWFEFGERDVWTLFSSTAFDFSVWEMWGALFYGGRLVIVPFAVSRSPDDYCDLLVRHQVTVINQTPSAFFPLADVIVRRNERRLALRSVIFGGEALEPSLLRSWYGHFDGAGPTLVNMYGITETTVHVTYRPLSATDLGRRSVIGVPIPDLRIYLLDDLLRPVPAGMRGEIFVGGEGVAAGYLNRPDLTALRFIQNPFGSGRLYRSGDLARQLPDGDIEYLGRGDTQVKVSGFRIELGEIEARYAEHAGIERAVVLVKADRAGAKRLVAYAVPAKGTARPSVTELRTFLRDKLPEHMVPPVLVWIDSVPLTVNGKADVSTLPDPPERRARELDTEYVAPHGATERALAAVWEDVLGIDGVGATDGFFALGGDSRQAVRAVARARDAHGFRLPVIALFERPTVRDLAALLTDASAPSDDVRTRAEGRERERALRGGGGEPIAVVGMACRFPGARDVREFWRNLEAGLESITYFDDETLDPSVSAATRADATYVRARGVLEDSDRFDAPFFGVVPREAQLMDPQQRVFLELSWETLEDAGYVPETYPGLIGVFGGVYTNSYAATVIARRPDVVEAYGEFQTMLLNEKDYVATRAAHKLGLTGPALSIHTACSTSLVAVCQAVESLRSFQSDIALAGGVTLSIPTRSGYFHEEGAMMSADGHTRPFDAHGSGTVFSDGAGMVALKRLRDAEHDGDTIHAVIRGAAVNNDGAKKASFTAPSVAGQAAVIAAAQANAGVEARSISYVEAHGTATPLGDPIEFQALTQVFQAGTSDVGFCAIGSVKSNIGHVVVAAGAAGLIKTALAFDHDLIPKTLHYTAPNPNLDLEGGPFRPVAEARPWPRGDVPRRAGVSSFGVGGTNAHVVLEEPPRRPAATPTRDAQLLVLSARNKAALDRASVNLARHLRDHPEQRLADVAYTLQVGRKAFAHRRAVAATSAESAVVVLETDDERKMTTRMALSNAPRVAFMFPGQGSQYPRMGAELYEHEPVFRDAFDRCSEIARPVLGRDLRQVLHAVGDEVASADALRQTSLTQPALFAIEYALAALWASWGVTPDAMIGHSVGEFVAAVIAGVFSVEDGMRLVAERGRMMQAMAPGTMLSVRTPAAALAQRLTGGLAIASENGPSLCVVAGPTDEVNALQAVLEAEGIFCRPLQTSHAFHSSMMEPVVAPFAELLRAVTLAAPRIRFVSTVTGAWITDEQARDPMYWASHLRETVRFGTGMATLLSDEPDVVLIEVGPRATLATLARQQVTDKKKQVCVASLGTSGDGNDELVSVLASLGDVWTAGVTPNWAGVHVGETLARVPLPTYPFERQRHWLEPRDVPVRGEPPVLAAEPAPPFEHVMPVASASAASPPPSLPTSMPPQTPVAPPRRERLTAALRETVELISGVDVGPDDTGASFVELGLDSLVLTQMAMALTKAHGVKISFRHLLEEHTSVDRVAEFLDRTLVAEPTAVPSPSPLTGQPVGGAMSQTTAATPASPTISLSPTSPSAPQAALQHLIQQQLQLMAQQLAVLGGAPAAVPTTAVGAAPAAPTGRMEPVLAASAGSPATNGTAAGAQTSSVVEGLLSMGPKREVYDAKKAFGAAPRITLTGSGELTPKQRARLDAFIRRYNARTRTSKEYTQANRGHMADPRVATGFRPLTKELVYPIVVERSRGSRMWDLDGNEYIDVVSGFGSNLFGWSAPFVVDALKAQLDRGFDVGPQHPLAGEVARMFCDFTGHDRAAFCNTGSEAVLGAIRIARTVTGRSLIVIFTGSYHGINDEVIVRGTKSLRTIPAAPGIMPSTSENVLVLDYGTPESLEIIRARAHELAAVIVEPVQSRRPDFQPKEFLQALRQVTTDNGVVYIWDEVITGFRSAPGGAQEIFGVRADLATYGKVVGGGISIGVIAGKREFMDALDGGGWQFGDGSVPEVGVTYFAGTFVRHPLALAAAKAVLTHLKEKGPDLQREVTAHATRLADTLNAHFVAVGAPLEIRRFASVWKTFITSDLSHGDLLFYMLRDRGVHIYDGFPCFMTTAHGDVEVDLIVEAFKGAVAEMQESGFMPAPAEQAAAKAPALDASAPPVPGARLGRDRDGTPAWFVAKEGEPGKFVKVGQD